MRYLGYIQIIQFVDVTHQSGLHINVALNNPCILATIAVFKAWLIAM